MADTRRKLIEAAIDLIEHEGDAGFSTRAVCAAARVQAPTLYHHFGSADGLLSAAISDAFEQFLAGQVTASAATDVEQALRESWDDYVRFAQERPRLYAAMFSRLLARADLPAANRSFDLLRLNVQRIASAGRLAVPEPAARQLAWASANAAAMLHVVAALGALDDLGAPSADSIDAIREQMVRQVLTGASGAPEGGGP